MIKIIILSDPICPWCYIGKKCFDDAINQFESHYFDIKWLPFQLNPNMPKEGMDRKNYLIKKFGNEKLNDETINIKLTGSAGQSLGAFLTKGICITVEGDCCFLT